MHSGKSEAVHSGSVQCILIKSDEFENSYSFYIFLLGYLKDSNVAAHSVDSDIF